ncbi:hypothetical protein CRG98_037680 [Punica granatum]|uniref:Uncharacterized protein n=1 Tax=Punica granatum TaxID=22663 RepID=A0A2I0IE49_PUNGR|nr:hypothetical protein CRG98_037680 [Punica granatum]
MELELQHASSFRSNRSDTERSLPAEGRVDDEVKLQWAAIDRLPTFRRLRTSLFDDGKVSGSQNNPDVAGKRVVDIMKLGGLERHMVGVNLGAVEVRYKDLTIEAEYEVVHGRPLPTLWNTLKSIFSIRRSLGCKNPADKIRILKGISGILKPSRKFQVSREILYNGYGLNEFVPQKASAYISQDDLHISEMTVRETLDFAARCQGVGKRADIMKEISKREKQAGIFPERDIDTYMKVDVDRIIPSHP